MLTSICRVTALLGVVLLVGLRDAAGQDAIYSAKVNEVARQFKIAVTGNKIAAGKIGGIKAELATLKSKAQALDELAATVSSEQSHLSSLRADKSNESAQVDELQRQLDQQSADGKSQVSALLAQQATICSGMGGTVQGQQCVFSCPQNNMSPCNAKMNDFNGRIEQIRTQLTALLKSLEAVDQQVDQAKEAEDNTQTAIAQTEKSLADDRKAQSDAEGEFNQLLKKADADIGIPFKPVKIAATIPAESPVPAGPVKADIVASPQPVAAAVASPAGSMIGEIYTDSAPVLRELWQGVNVHVCPVGYAMAGAHVINDWFTCVRVVDDAHLSEVRSIVDAGTQGNYGLGDMHVCPAGMYMRGLNDPANLLVCSYGANVQLDAPSLDANGATQGRGMHMCPATSAGQEVMTGIHNLRNDFACATFRQQ